jgi:hypothetical protein
MDKTKEANFILNEVSDIFKHLSADLVNRAEMLKTFDTKMVNEVANFETEKKSLEKQLQESQKVLDETKATYTTTEKEKTLLIDRVKNSFESITGGQIQLLKLKQQETDVRDLYLTL